MKQYKKLKKFMFTMQSKMSKDPSLKITAELVKDLLEETAIDIEVLGGREELVKLLKIHPRFESCDL